MLFRALDISSLMAFDVNLQPAPTNTTAMSTVLTAVCTAHLAARHRHGRFSQWPTTISLVHVIYCVVGVKDKQRRASSLRHQPDPER